MEYLNTEKFHNLIHTIIKPNLILSYYRKTNIFNLIYKTRNNNKNVFKVCADVLRWKMEKLFR